MLNVSAAHRTIHRVYFEYEVRGARLSWFLLDDLREKRSARRFEIASSCFLELFQGATKNVSPYPYMGQRSETTVRVPLCSIERRSALSALVFVRKNARDGRRDGRNRRISDIPRITRERTNHGPLTRVLDIIRSFPREGVTALSRFDWRIGSLYSLQMVRTII